MFSDKITIRSPPISGDHIAENNEGTFTFQIIFVFDKDVLAEVRLQGDAW